MSKAPRCHSSKARRPFLPVSLTESPLINRRPEEEKQVGLCDPCDPGPAHPHPHHHRNPACRRLRDNHRKRHQNHRHLCRGHHPEESKAVSDQWAEKCPSVRVTWSWKTYAILRSLYIYIYMWKRCRGQTDWGTLGVPLFSFENKPTNKLCSTWTKT